MDERKTFADVERQLISEFKRVLENVGFLDGDTASVELIKSNDSVFFFSQYSNKDVAKYKTIIVYDTAKIGAMKYDDNLPRAFNAHIATYIVTSLPLMSSKISKLRDEFEKSFQGTDFMVSYLEESRDSETKRLIITYDVSRMVSL